ncbi:MAG: DUF3846 domain-containing protein [Actinomycetales bacterium]|nr:DUF3846 domain-containing protein [Actinomycetales bacterium]
MSALLIAEDGEIAEVDLSATDTLRTMYQVIGCSSVDVVRLTTNLDMWIDDEGMITDRPVNVLATLLARHFGRTYQPYCGPALLGGMTDDGDTINLTDDQIRAVLTRLQDIVDRL